jgi:integrase/recombinase XerD
MKQMINEIDDFNSIAELQHRTKQTYRKRLLEFTRYLSKLLATPLSEVHLEKVTYLPYDNETGLFLPIDETIIDKFFEANLTKKYSYLSSMFCSLSSFFRYLSTEYNYRNPMSDIDFKLRDHYVEPKNKRVFNRQEILKLIWSILKNSDEKNLIRDAILFITLFTTGCRINEILSLTPCDLMVDENTFFLKKTKNKRQKYVATKLGLIPSLKFYSNSQSLKKDDLIFSDNGRSLTRDKVHQLLHDYSKKVNLPETRVHDTRGSFISIMYENGTDISIIQQMVNHMTMNSTQVYIADNVVRNRDLNVPFIDNIRMDLKKLIGH